MPWNLFLRAVGKKAIRGLKAPVGVYIMPIVMSVPPAEFVSANFGVKFGTGMQK